MIAMITYATKSKSESSGSAVKLFIFRNARSINKSATSTHNIMKKSFFDETDGNIAKLQLILKC